MNKIIFECETITPMFLSGADGRTPELRAPSIKGALRFWWRAMNGHLPLNELRKEEAKIFGGTGENEGRSTFSIRIFDKKVIQTYKISLTPHHRTGYCSPNNSNCFYRNNTCMKANTKEGKFYNLK